MVVKCGEGRKKTCNQCEGLKEENYMNDNFCAKCRSAINKEKRLQKRWNSGKPPMGSGRNPNCSKCGELKDLQHRTSGYCRKCNSERMRNKTTKRREDLGLRPIGSGRKETCCACDGLKENPKAGYCNACHRKRDREWRLETGRSQKNRTGKCQCGKPFASYSKCYCYECASEWRRNYLATHPDVRERLNRSARERYYNSGEEQFKAYVRNLTNKAIQNGYLMRMPCEICNTELNIDAHHDDYMKPFDIRWLCRLHHAEHHKNEKKE